LLLPYSTVFAVEPFFFALFVWKIFRFAFLDTHRKQRGLVASAGGQFDGY
jgi:hypothetical protein